MARERAVLTYDELELIIEQAKVILQSEDLTEDQKIEQIRELDNITPILKDYDIIFQVCKTGSIEIFLSLYEQDLQDNHYHKPYTIQQFIFGAISSHNIEMLEYILTIKPESIDYKDINKYSVLHCAAETGNMEMVIFFLERIPELLNLKTNARESVLYFAAKGGNLEVVKFLFDQKPDLIYLLTNSRDSVLNCAAEGGNLEVVKFLFDQKP